MRPALLFAAFLAASCSGCAQLHPKAGDDCTSDDAVCTGKSAALVCRGGKYAQTTCGGPAGCSMAPSNRDVSCDQTLGAKDGEPCLARYNGQAQCEQDGKPGFLMCRSGKWESGQCSKAGAVCTRSGDGIVCRSSGGTVQPAPLDGGEP